MLLLIFISFSSCLLHDNRFPALHSENGSVAVGRDARGKASKRRMLEGSRAEGRSGVELDMVPSIEGPACCRVSGRLDGQKEEQVVPRQGRQSGAGRRHASAAGTASGYRVRSSGRREDLDGVLGGPCRSLVGWRAEEECGGGGAGIQKRLGLR